jgi:queuine tRNA-ribosyltransferase
MNLFSIQKKAKDSEARAGTIHTPHGDLPTPALMIVGTKANVKNMTPIDLKECQVPVVLCNTYHLFLYPGEERIDEMGGLSKFMSWDGPTFTDSGGFQVFSMGLGNEANEIKSRYRRHTNKQMLQITEEGALFQSYRDGQKHLLTAEKSLQIQHKIGADLIVAFDECTPLHVDKKYTQKSMEMTHRWLDRSIAEHQKLGGEQVLYGVIQGGFYDDLRDISVDYILKSDTPGICIGGSLGTNKVEMHGLTKHVMARMNGIEKPVHLLGIGDLDDLIQGVEQGIDTFDCVTPTRNARHGLLFSKNEPLHKLRMGNSQYKNDPLPIDPSCECKVCQNYSRAYIHYLLKAEEALGLHLATYHNIYFITKFMRDMRNSILEDRFPEFKKDWGYEGL